MSQRLDELLQQCTVKLTIPNTMDLGSGFFVAPELILTCVHVIKAAGLEPVKVSWQNQEDVAEATVEVYLPAFDLALLRLNTKLANQPCVYLDEEFQPYDDFYTYGYPDKFPKGASVTSQCDGSAVDDSGVPLILFSKGRIRPGLSGSPLLNRRTNKVCGIVRFTHDRGTDLGGGAIPTATILAQLNNLIELQRQFHQIDTRWKNFLQETLQDSLSQPFYCNLPSREYPEFIGRKLELKRLLELISLNHRAPIISVDGVGGVGKTALVLEAAHLCKEAKNSQYPSNAPIFDAIIFTSAKDYELGLGGIVERPQRQATLRDIFRMIARTLDDLSIMQAAPEEQHKRVYASLGRQRTLLIVDNMEAIQNQEEVLSFLDDLPDNAKAVITTRKRIVTHACITLDSLSVEEGVQLILRQAEEKGVTIGRQQAKQLYYRFSGIPVALLYAVGQRAAGYSLKRILDPLTPNSIIARDIGRFCFERSVTPLRGTPAHRILMSFVIFRGAPVREALTQVAGLDHIAMDDGLAQLKQLSLVREKQERYGERYRVLTLTREYTQVELAAYPEFEREARERCFKWYMDFAKKYGGEDWEEWSIKYDHLDEEWSNLQGVLEWLASQERYTDVKNLWKHIDNYIDLYGYWEQRLDWLQWLIAESSRRTSELSTYVEAMSKRGWTLTLIGGKQQIEASKLLEKAWELRESVDLGMQAYIANHMAVLRMTQERYEQALQWLDRQQDLVNQASFEEQYLIRHQILIDYYRAEIISYWRQDDDQAKHLFEQVIERGQKIGWQRFVNYAQNRLGDIAIIQGDLPKAEKLLKQGLFVAQHNKEKRRIAHYKASLVRLEKACGNLQKAHELAIEALKLFKREGITKDAEEMRSLLYSLE
jgi:TPR repeat protein